MTLGDVIEGVRVLDPRFTEEAVPDRVFGMRFTAIQRALTLLGTQRKRDLFIQTMTIGFDFSSGNAPGTAGAGTSGGLPVALDGQTLEVVESYAGNLVGFDLTDATVEVAGFVAGAATTTTVKKTGATWTVNAYANKVADVTDGPGSGADAARYIVSNTADTLTILGTWKATPVVGQTVIRVVDAPTEVTEGLGVATALPALSKTTGYLVRLDASGNPYLDLTKPIVARFETGIGLPPFTHLIGGTVFLTGTNVLIGSTGTPSGTAPLQQEFRLTTYEDRFVAKHPAGYILNGQLYLIGTSLNWIGADSIAIRYVPIPPAFGTTATPLSEYFLLPDTAYDALTQWAYADGVARLAAAGDKTADVGYAQQMKTAAVSTWLDSLTMQQNQLTMTTRRNR